MNLPALRFRSLQARIVIVFLLLLLTVQVAGYAFIQNAILANARRHAQDELAVGARVFERFLDQHAQRLTQTGLALAGDFALREAIATRDRTAIGAILSRHPERATADLAMLVGPDGQLLGEPRAARGSRRPRLRGLPGAQRVASGRPRSESWTAACINSSRCRCDAPRRWAGW